MNLSQMLGEAADVRSISARSWATTGAWIAGAILAGLALPFAVGVVRGLAR